MYIDWQYYLDGEYLAYCMAETLWDDYVPVLYFDIQDELFEPYKIEAVIVLNGPLDDDDLGDKLCIGLGSRDKAVRVFVGNLWKFKYEGGSQLSGSNFGNTQMQYIYRIWLAHPLENLRKEVLFQISEGQTKRQIITNYLNNASITYQSNLVDDNVVCETNTQYNESTLDYIIRLMQEVGVTARFDSDDYTADDISAGVDYTFDLPDYMLSENIQDAPTYELSFTGVRIGNSDFEQIIDFTSATDTIGGGYILNDYNFKTPDTLTQGSSTTDSWVTNTKTVYPTNDDNSQSANEHAKLLSDRESTRNVRFKAKTTSFMVTAGGILSTSDNAADFINSEYFIEKTHMILDRKENGWEFVNFIEGVEYDPDYVPVKTKQKPIVYGHQTAIVIGTKDNTQINVDNFGRVKVKFIWSQDKNNSTNFTNVSNPSAWARVMHWGAAGNGWGNVSLPRVGQEVVVGFLNGDSDCPIVLGAVYNGTNGYPLSLPDHNCTTIMRTQTVGELGKSGERYNEFKMVDTELDELVSLRAQHNAELMVFNNYSRTIMGNYTTTMTGDEWRTLITSGNRYEIFGSIFNPTQIATIAASALVSTALMDSALDLCTIGMGVKIMHIATGVMGLVVDSGDLTMAVPLGAVTTAAGVWTTTVAGIANMKVGGIFSTSVGGSCSVSVIGSYSLTVGGACDIDVSGECNFNVAGAYNSEIEGEYSLSGLAAVSIESALAMNITAGAELNITAGSITIEAGDISITGAGIEMTAGAAFSITASLTVAINGAMIELG